MALATMMANGNIIPQNLPQAKQIFTELAKQNVPNARESLASVEKLLLRRINKLPPLLRSQLLKNSKETIAPHGAFLYHHKAISPLTPIKPIMVLIIKGLMLFHLNRRLAQKYQKRSALAAQQVKCQHITSLGSRLAVKGTVQKSQQA